MASISAATLLILAAHLIDPRSGKILSPAAVLVEDGKIKEVASRIAAPNATTINLGDATLLPGLIDSHTHLLLNVTLPSEAEINNRSNGLFAPAVLLAVAESPSKRVLLGAQMAREDLESGFTTVRNLGHSGIDGDTALRDAINAGRITGPRILASARKIAQRGDYVQSLNPALADAILRQEFLAVTGVDSARQAVFENLLYNVDVIKVAIDDNFTVAEIAAIADEAHRQHLKVAAHAVTTVSIQTAIDGGVDTIEHGNAITDEQLKQMRDKGIWFDFTPTFYGGLLFRIMDASIVTAPDASRGRSVEQSKQRYHDLVQRVLKSGVNYASGSDMLVRSRQEPRRSDGRGVHAPSRSRHARARRHPRDHDQRGRHAGLAGPHRHDRARQSGRHHRRRRRSARRHSRTGARHVRDERGEDRKERPVSRLRATRSVSIYVENSGDASCYA